MIKRLTIMVLSLLMLNVCVAVIPASADTGAMNTAATLIPICNTPQGKQTAVCQDVNQQSANNSNVFVHIIKDVIDIISFIVGVAAVILLIVSGIQFATSGGDTNATASAKRTIMGALIGIIVVVLAQSIVIFVLDKIKI